MSVGCPRVIKDNRLLFLCRAPASLALQSGSDRSPYTVADTRREAETGTEVIRQQFAAVEIVRHCKIADILHHLFGSVCRRIVMIGVAVVCAVAKHRFLILLESPEIGFERWIWIEA